MGAVTSKGYDLAAVHGGINELGAVAVVQQLGNPISDPYLSNLVQDGKWQIITDATAVAVGDLVYAGNARGIVTEVLNDGEGSPTDNRIICTLKTDQIIQEIGTDPTNREISLDFIDNDDDVGDDKHYLNTLKLLGAGVVFMRPV